MDEVTLKSFTMIHLYMLKMRSMPSMKKSKKKYSILERFVHLELFHEIVSYYTKFNLIMKLSRKNYLENAFVS